MLHFYNTEAQISRFVTYIYMKIKENTVYLLALQLLEFRLYP